VDAQALLRAMAAVAKTASHHGLSFMPIGRLASPDSSRKTLRYGQDEPDGGAVRCGRSALSVRLGLGP
jgi:hypothetical protein